MNDVAAYTRHADLSSMYQHFVIDITPARLLKLLGQYGLKVSDVAGIYSLHTTTLVDAVSALHLSQALAQWPEKLTWPTFNQQILSLIEAWLKDYKIGVPLGSALTLINQLRLQRMMNNTLQQSQLKLDNVYLNGQFARFLMHLTAEVTNALDQYRFQYVENFDLGSNLPNQHFLLKLLAQHIEDFLNQPLENLHNQQHFGLIIVNLNLSTSQNTKSDANNALVIKSAAKLIYQQSNDDVTLFMLSANELGVLVEHLNFPAQLNLIIAKLASAFEHALPIAGSRMIVKPYFGCVGSFNMQQDTAFTSQKSKANPLATQEDYSDEAMIFYEYARLALNYAVENHYQVEVYDYHIKNTSSNIHALDEAIIEALQHNELSIHLQPIITLPKEHCLNAEILIRWHHPHWHDVSATRLIDTIYKKGFGKVFIRWLINTTCQTIGQLHVTHGQPIALTMNLSVNDLLDDDLPNLLAQSIALWDITADHLIIEITESDFLMDEVRAAAVIDQIAQLGCKLALDDFGTGYSSMARLRNMPVDFVKIDQSFVRNIAHSVQDRQIVQSIVELAQSLGKQVVAEGVEDQQCLDILKEMRCEKIQGYVYSKPISSEHFSDWLFKHPHFSATS